MGLSSVTVMEGLQGTPYTMEVEDSQSFRRILEDPQAWVYIRRILRVQKKKCGFIAKYLRRLVCNLPGPVIVSICIAR